MTGAQNWFTEGGADYAQFRPSYGADLAQLLSELAPEQDVALDVGCGSAQLSVLLGGRFETVLGIDPSLEQLQHAAPAAGCHYICASAEQLPLADSCASLVCAAQAAHWFDLARFYVEVQRVARPGALLALISYGVLQLPDGLNERFLQFYHQEIGRYWPAQRKLVDDGYRSLSLPFAELNAPQLSIELEWSLPQLLGYIGTWSALRQARACGEKALLERFAEDLARRWGVPQRTQRVRWPLNLRLARL